LIWTIEHIFPEGTNIPTSWVNMIAGGDVEKAKEMQQKLVHKLGNLTLSGFNTNLSNSDFIKKRDLVDSSGRYIGYKNGLFLNKSLKEAESWTEEGIIKRTSDLIEKIIEMYSIPNEK